MKILVACEYSGRVSAAFRRLGHDAWSCDIQPTLSQTPRHLQTDVRNVIDWGWDMMIAFPPCTYLCNISKVNQHLLKTETWQREHDMAVEFFCELYLADIPKICIENPRGEMNNLMKPSQVIQPWQFGHPYTKLTCLWLKNLPLLKSTKIVRPARSWIEAARKAEDRSKTFWGVAKAMAEQWGTR
jgi:hypothetical protein